VNDAPSRKVSIASGVSDPIGQYISSFIAIYQAAAIPFLRMKYIIGPKNGDELTIDSEK
jgi:hypothetical protein